MKKLLVFILAIALCSLSLFALSEEAQSLVGSWRATRLSGEEGDFDLTGAAAALTIRFFRYSMVKGGCPHLLAFLRRS